MTVLDVQWVATERCQPTVGATGIDMPYHQTIGPCGTSPATRRRSTGPVATVCSDTPRPSSGSPRTPRSRSAHATSQLFGTDTNGGIGLRGDLDVYVVDVEGLTYVVVANEVGSPPQEARDELAGILASVEFVQPD